MKPVNILNKLKESSEYRYVTTHGTGPGTLPKDVNLIKSEDINSNGRVAIYVDRPLTKEELEKYDIKPEWIQESVKCSTFKQGNEEFFVQPYKYGDDSFNIKYETHGNRHISNEPFTIEGEYNFIYDENKNEVKTGMVKDGKVVPDNWGKMTNVSKDKWLDMVHNPEQDLIPWVQGAYLD